MSWCSVPTSQAVGSRALYRVRCEYLNTLYCVTEMNAECAVGVGCSVLMSKCESVIYDSCMSVTI